MPDIPLRHGGSWVGLTIAYLALGVAGLGAAGFSVLTQGALAGPGLLAALAAGCIGLGLSYLPGALRPPSMAIRNDAVVIDFPGLLREPLAIPHAQVRAVYFRDVYDVHPWLGGSWSRAERPKAPVNAHSVPTLTFGSGVGWEWTLLFVLDPPLPFRGLIRSGSFARFLGAVLLRQWSNLPGPGTVAHGLACEPDRLQAAVDALFAAGFALSRPPLTPSDREWLARPPWNPFRRIGA